MSTNARGRKRGVYSQSARVLRILDHLAAHHFGVALADLATEFGISVRQVRRDLAALEEGGHPWEPIEVGGRAGARLVEHRRVQLTLSQRERYALLAVRRVFDVLEGTPLHEDVRSIYDKLTASLPETQREELAGLGDRFVCLPDGGRKSYRDKEEVIDAILTGVLRRKLVRFQYRAKSGQVTEGLLAPYAMVLYKQGLYAIGRIEEDGATAPSREKTYAIERFTHAEHIRNAPFEVPADFDVDRYFQGAFGIYLGAGTEHVVIDFAPRAQELVEARLWHPSQRIHKLPGGGIRLELDVSDLTQVAQWVVGWGPLAVVRAPAALRERVAREHEEAAQHYAAVSGELAF